jgi:cell wall-associated NlpC family hydrolase
MFGISLIPIIPLRSEPSSKSEMVSQLLFGQKYIVLHTQPNWLKIETIDDKYIGWINDTQAEIIDESEWLSLQNPSVVLNYPFLKIMVNETPMYISTGSIIYSLTHFKVGEFNIITNLDEMNIQVGLEPTALQYLNTPYLWGGKTPWGIDCSGFTQTVFAQNGISLKRDAYQQAEQGEIVAFLAESKIGDLAFFDNDEGKIIHVGILLENGQIIHANGRVRIDKIDNYGIMNSETRKYSHKLRIVKRII